MGTVIQENISTVKLNSDVVNTAIRWVIWRIEKKGGKFEDKEKFRKELKNYINRTLKITKQSVVIATSDTFINKKRNGVSLLEIFENNGIEKKDIPQFSLTLKTDNILLADGYSATKNILEYNYCIKRFEYKPVKGINSFRY